MCPGLVPIRFGAQTVDPVTGVVAPVVGVQLDVWNRTVVPVTASQCLNIRETPDMVLVSKFVYIICFSKAVRAERMYMCVFGAGRGFTEGVQNEGSVLERAEGKGGGTGGRF